MIDTERESPFNYDHKRLPFVMKHAMSPRLAMKVSPRSPHQEVINDEYEYAGRLADEVGSGNVENM
jgi:hypothetical protein